VATVRFFFGSGWWVLWYLAFYAVLLVFVILWLVVFGLEIKPEGARPDLPSPASVMVFMIAFGLAVVTLANGLLFARVLSWPWYAALVVPFGLTALVLGVGLPLNQRLAVEQSVPALLANLLYAAVTVAVNLVMMWLGRTRPRAAAPLFG
jgi:hypothetical protein